MYNTYIRGENNHKWQIKYRNIWKRLAKFKDLFIFQIEWKAEYGHVNMKYRTKYNVKWREENKRE